MKKTISIITVLFLLIAVVPAGTAADFDTASEFDFSDYTIPVIANKDNSLEKDYEPELLKVPSTNFHLDKVTLRAYQRLSAAAWDAGHKKLRLNSAYRSYATQQILHNNKIEALKPKYGAKAAEMAAMQVARPGQSEHQLGNTIDLSTNGTLSQSFGKTDTGKWLSANAHRFGFIMRYPKNKTDITGVIYEPWHYRYVGEDIAAYIYNNDLTLEEYVELAKAK